MHGNVLVHDDATATDGVLFWRTQEKHTVGEGLFPVLYKVRKFTRLRCLTGFKTARKWTTATERCGWATDRNEAMKGKDIPHVAGYIDRLLLIFWYYSIFTVVHLTRYKINDQTDNMNSFVVVVYLVPDDGYFILLERIYYNTDMTVYISTQTVHMYVLQML